MASLGDLPIETIEHIKGFLFERDLYFFYYTCRDYHTLTKDQVIHLRRYLQNLCYGFHQVTLEKGNEIALLNKVVDAMVLARITDPEEVDPITLAFNQAKLKALKAQESKYVKLFHGLLTLIMDTKPSMDDIWGNRFWLKISMPSPHIAVQEWIFHWGDTVKYLADMIRAHLVLNTHGTVTLKRYTIRFGFNFRDDPSGGVKLSSYPADTLLINTPLIKRQGIYLLYEGRRSVASRDWFMDSPPPDKGELVLRNSNNPK